ncbi:MAG: threonine synthase [Oscillospiraceae bacterium]|jgi:threonine synthase|nr:threonine synthase [Oscillospiraceae bacterium]
MDYISTRGKGEPYSSARAILQGLAPDGGLFAPRALPALPPLRAGAYAQTAAAVMSLFFGDLPGIDDMCRKAYACPPFDTPAIAPLNGDVLELFHGPTCAFKDMALQVLPFLMSAARDTLGISEDILILTATSGDTGKAALEAFADKPGVKILVFYPLRGVSPMQQLQMTTQEGANVRVCAVNGNFDDTQSAVKAIFDSPSFAQKAKEAGTRLSSANSINIGRLIPQIAYYAHAYNLSGCKDGEKVNFCVPTGNFGNILAGLYAKLMGLPIGKLLCASNENRVLTDALTTGEYNAGREFRVTYSPSMDILVSGNFERALFLLSGGDAGLTASLMARLREERRYTVPPELLGKLREHFAAYSCTDAETLEEIALTGADPHTAVALRALRRHREQTGDGTKTIVLGTASCYKFLETMRKAGLAPDESRMPRKLKEAANKPARFTGFAEKGDLPRVAEDFMRGG